MAHLTSPEIVTIQKGTSSASAHLYGATLTSWKPGGSEVLFVSRKSQLDGSKPIRGGVPVVFPQFGPWECGPQHGFARRLKWTVKDKEPDHVTFQLEDSDSTRQMWNYRFRIEYTIALISDEEVKMAVLVTNTGDEKFDFTFLLHTYFSVADVTKCEITGLKGCSYIDKVKDNASATEESDKVVLSEFSDRIYLRTPSEATLNGVVDNRKVKITKSNLPDTVVWNPWQENARKMDDFGDDEWKQTICVEAGRVGERFFLNPGESFHASQVLQVCS